MEAKAASADHTLSKKLAIEDGDIPHVDDPGPSNLVVMKKRKANDGNPVMTTFLENSKLSGQKRRHKELNLSIIKLFCIQGLPTRITSTPEWRNMFSIADSSYKPADRQMLKVDQIVSEAEHIYAIQLKQLKTQEDLTISCDGGTLHGQEAFWTLHVSNPLGKVFLMETHEATSESHTTVWIKDFVLEVHSTLIRTRLGCLPFRLLT
jgi:hypothetical protein